MMVEEKTIFGLEEEENLHWQEVLLKKKSQMHFNVLIGQNFKKKSEGLSDLLTWIKTIGVNIRSE